MSVSSIASAASAATTASGAAKSRQTLADNFDTFLTLLTTQLKAQSPLDPMDTNQFTQELVQFSQVEQQINMNSQLESLISLITQQTSSSIVNYLGTTVTAEGATTDLANGQASWLYTSPQAVSGATVTIRNESGSVVYSGPTDLSEGNGEYVWDGRTSTGSRAPNGRYSITIDARDSTNKAIDVSTSFSGTVTGIDLSGSEPVLEIGNTRVPISSVQAIST